MKMTYDPRAMDEAWIAELRTRLAHFCAEIEKDLSSGESRVTPSDFPDADIDQDDLDLLMDQFQ